MSFTSRKIYWYASLKLNRKGEWSQFWCNYHTLCKTAVSIFFFFAWSNQRTYFACVLLRCPADSMARDDVITEAAIVSWAVDESALESTSGCSVRSLDSWQRRPHTHEPLIDSCSYFSYTTGLGNSVRVFY